MSAPEPPDFGEEPLEPLEPVYPRKSRASPRGKKGYFGESAESVEESESVEPLAGQDQFKAGEQGTQAQPFAVTLRAISDQAKSTVADDRLGFAPHVRAVAAFLSAPETVAPLSIAIGSAWGKGKTTFMQMIENEMLTMPKGRARFATVWFNPWKYGESSQVWAAFLDIVTKKVHESIGILRKLQFEVGMLFSNFSKKFTFALFVRSLLLAFVGIVLGFLAFAPDMHSVHEKIFRHLLGLKENETMTIPKSLGYSLPAIGFCYVFYRLYFDVFKKFNFSLLDYLRMTNFEDKVGTLAHFEREMKNLNACVPVTLKIMVFIDDLDRCKPDVLAEMIEALNLLEVSRRCIFLLGMDSEIVAKKIEAGSPELRSLIEGVDIKYGAFQRGPGHQFLEKILQASISVPAYGSNDMARLVSSLIADGGKWASQFVPTRTPPSEPSGDSEEVKAALQQYAGTYFRNPRRLKRFVNSFRLRARLAPETECKADVDQLARFLVLVEKWPGLIAYFRDHPEDLNNISGVLTSREVFDEKQNKIGFTQREQVFSLLKDPLLINLFLNPEPLSNVLAHLCDWSGFEFSYSSGNAASSSRA